MLDTEMESILHRGRPRSEATNTAILDAVLELLDTTCYKYLTMEAVAQKAGVGKPTIYRRWKTKASLVADAFVYRSNKELPLPEDTGSIEGDLRALLYSLADRLNNTSDGKVLRGLAFESTQDADSAQAYAEFVESRRAIARELILRGRRRGEVHCMIDVETLIDEIYGALSYRYMIRRQPLERNFIDAHIRYIVDSLALLGNDPGKPGADSSYCCD
jgi:AcrR family transcriptional regulator